MLSDLQAHELHTKHSAEAMKAEKWQFEYKNLHDKYDALLKEKEVSQRAFSRNKKQFLYGGGNVHIVYRVYLYTEALSFPSRSSNSFDFSDDK